jgi:hypothetical protein
MRTVNFRDGVLYQIAHLLGIDPAADLQKDHVAAWVGMINNRIIEACEYWEWPELEIAEERAFRTIWKSTRQFNLNSELYYIPTTSYYKAIAVPPVGTLPTDTNYFEQLTVTSRYIALDQPGRRPIDQIIGIYYGNPETCCMFGLPFYPNQNGIQLNGYSGPTAFVKYKIRPPQFSAVAWDTSVNYQKNDIRYFNDDGECYQALTANIGQPPTNGAIWRKVEMPEFLAPFVRYQVAADASDDVTSTQKWGGAAEDSLIRKVNKLLEQGQRHQYQIRRHSCRVHYPLGTSGFFWSVSPPWTETFVSTLTDEDDPFSEEINSMLEDGLTQILNGNDFVDVVFNSWTGGSAYSFDELVVQNFIDSPPQNIFPTILVSKTASGFRYLLNSSPDNDNYFLKWRIVP